MSGPTTSDFRPIHASEVRHKFSCSVHYVFIIVRFISYACSVGTCI